MNGYKVLSISAERVKRLKAVSLTLDGGNLVVVGKPDEGKTTALDLLWMAFKPRAIGPETISAGSDEARISIIIGNPARQFTVTRKITRDGERAGKLTITDSEGGKFPAAFLDTIISDLTFDPTEFARAEGKSQVDLLLKVVKLPDGISIDALDRSRETLYEQRKTINRDLDKAKAKLPAEEPAAVAEVKINEVLTGLELEMESLGSAANEKLAKTKAANREVMAAVKASNEANKEKRERLAGFRTSWGVVNKSMEEIQAKIDALQAEFKMQYQKRADLELAIKTGEPIVAALEDVDVDSLAAKQDAQENAVEAELKDACAPLLAKRATAVKDAEETNAKARARKAWEKDKAEVDSNKVLSDSLTKQIEDVDLKKKSVLESVEWPMEGLSIRDGHVIYRDVILSQCGTSVRMQVSCAIAMALNPKLNTIRIDEGESLGAEGREMIFRWAAEKGYQVLMSVVKDGPADEGEIEIIDGTLSNVPTAVAPALVETAA